MPLVKSLRCLGLITVLGVVVGVVETGYAQTQIKPRVILMVDTSGSMTDTTFTPTRDTFSDGSFSYTDASFTRSPASVPAGFGYAIGRAIGGTCPSTMSADWDGVNSRMFAAKGAVTNVINGSGDVDWGLMRYAGPYCNIVNTLSGFACTMNNQCASGQTCAAAAPRRCTCANDGQCRTNEFCIGGKCERPDNLCVDGSYGMTDTRLDTENGGSANRNCKQHFGLPMTFNGTQCSSGQLAAGDAQCATQQTCWDLATDCNSTPARCTAVGGGVPLKSCTCTMDSQCETGYTCQTGRCVYARGCMPGTGGGQMVIDPASGNSLAILPWVDGIENYNGTVGTTNVANPELRAEGNTPLGGTARAAADWYRAIKLAASDPQLACRPYVLVQLTDGLDTCECTSSGCAERTSGPPAAAREFVNETITGARVPNKVYVIGLSIAAGSQTQLNAIAAAGGTGTARFADNQQQIEAALADIVSSSVLFEVCNAQDDDCNTFIDEGLGVYKECTSNPQCAAGQTCNAGRCTCTTDAQCGAGFVCAAGGAPRLCVPACSTGQGTCQRSGVRKCSGLGTACCVNDGAAACTALTPGAPGTEICNGLDDNCNGLIDEGGVCQACNPTTEVCDGRDNDCDGIVDNPVTPAVFLVDENLQCGTDIGECSFGSTRCCDARNLASCTKDATANNPNNEIRCVGGQGPAAEVCDNLDNDCDNVIDGMTSTCYSGPAGTQGVGICVAGQRVCTAGMTGMCVGEQTPLTEICNGLDDNCDTLVDNVPGAGASCCPSGNCTAPSECRAGTMQCSGGMLQCVGATFPTIEICDGKDNDCNGLIDDVPGVGATCTPPVGCPGKLQCNVMTMMLECIPGTTMPEVCNGLDDDCDGSIDEAGEVSANDPRIGAACDIPMPPVDKPPCTPGMTVCLNGMPVCQGGIKPTPNLCDGISRDCTGMANTSGNCPIGFTCLQGICAAPCAGGEFPCPGGFICHQVNPTTRLCIPDGCVRLNCMPGTICRIDTAGMAACIDPCVNVTCSTGFRCKGGVCVDDSCKSFGCPQGQKCEGTPPLCVEDKCFGVTCPPGQFCKPADGTCSQACAGPCPPGTVCDDGMCVGDPCAAKTCFAGEVCTVVQGMAMCVSNTCIGGCQNGDDVCCGGRCSLDPCRGLECPGQTQCELDSACQPYCTAQGGAADRIVGAGGGGFTCGVAAGQAPRGGLEPLGLLLLLGLMLTRRRACARRNH